MFATHWYIPPFSRSIHYGLVKRIPLLVSEHSWIFSNFMKSSREFLIFLKVLQFSLAYLCHSLAQSIGQHPLKYSRSFHMKILCLSLAPTISHWHLLSMANHTTKTSKKWLWRKVSVYEDTYIDINIYICLLHFLSKTALTSRRTKIPFIYIYRHIYT